MSNMYGYGPNPYALLAQMQAMGGQFPQFAQQQQPQPMAPQMNPNQQGMAQNGMGSRAFYSPFNSPYSGMRQGGPNYQPMPPAMTPGAGANVGFTGQPVPMGAQQFEPGFNPMDRFLDQMRNGGGGMSPQGMNPQGNPSIGLSEVVRQMQGGLNPINARQQLAGLAGVPQRGPGFSPPPMTSTWSSQGAAPMPPPTLPNQFSQGNRTRGMSWNPNTGRSWGGWGMGGGGQRPSRERLGGSAGMTSGTL